MSLKLKVSSLFVGGGVVGWCWVGWEEGGWKFENVSSLKYNY